MVQTKRLIHVILHTFILITKSSSEEILPSTHTSHPCHHHISTGRHPIIPTLTFHMPMRATSLYPRLTTSSTLYIYIQKTIHKSTLLFLSFSDTPHIHLDMIRSVLSRLFRFAFIITQVSVPYVNQLWIQALYIFPFMQYDAPRAVRIGDNSLNFAQAHLTLVLAASSTPPPAPSVSPK